MLEAYSQHVAERAALGVPPKPLDDAQTAALVELLKNPPAGEEAFLVDLLENRVPAGVDQAAYVKAAFLAALAKGEATSPLVSKERAVYLLGTMLGGYNVAPLVALLDDAALAELAPPTRTTEVARAATAVDAMRRRAVNFFTDMCPPCG